MACAPAPAAIAQQMYTQAIMTKMIAKYTQGGEPIDKVDGLGRAPSSRATSAASSPLQS